jgi:quinol monooxygenase YgiN
MTENPPQKDDGPVVFINIFTVKPGKIAEFVELQRKNLERSRSNVPGWRGSRLHRSLDGRTAIMVSMFDSVADHQRVHQTQRFSEHVERLAPLVEKVEPGYYQIVHEVSFS